jgi:ribosome biogenesis protein YTM1
MFIHLLLFSQVRARFVSRTPEYVVTDAPIAVPTKLARAGLSEVVNHLLGSAVDEQVPFDFLINDRLLRSSLEKFLNDYNVNTEDVVVIEYIPAIIISEDSKTSEMESWVGCLDVQMDGFVVCGLYDGNVRICDASKDYSVVLTQSAHEEPIRSIFSWSDAGRQVVLTASKDHTVRCWIASQQRHATIAGASKKDKASASASAWSMALAATLSGHHSSVEALEVFGAERSIASGDWAGHICVHNGSLVGAADAMSRKHDEEDEGAAQSKSKRRKGAAGTKAADAEKDSSVSGSGVSAELAPLFTIHAHTQAVTGIGACKEEDASNLAPARQMYSCSWDHSLKLWDIETQNCVTTFMTPKVVTSLHYSRRANAVATSHTDGRVRLYDARQREAVPAMETLGRAEVWMSAVR